MEEWDGKRSEELKRGREVIKDRRGNEKNRKEGEEEKKGCLRGRRWKGTAVKEERGRDGEKRYSTTFKKIR
jgi:hypothetical protein